MTTYPNGTRKNVYAFRSLFFALLVASIFPSGLSFVLFVAMFGVWFLIDNWNIGARFYLLVIPLLAMFLCGLVGAYQNEFFDALKDIWYLGKIVLTMGVGFLLGKYIGHIRDAIKCVILVATLSSIFHIISVGMLLSQGNSLFDIRDAGVYGYLISIVGLAFALTKGLRDGLEIRPTVLYIVTIILMTSLVLSASRTYLIVLAILLVVLNGLIRINAKLLMKIAVVILVSFALAPFISGVGMGGGDGEVNLVEKFAKSFSEISIKEYETEEDINQFWRGFEGQRVLSTYLEGDVMDMSFGQGFGALVDLGFYIRLGGDEMRFIPHFHNGYLYVLLKFGLIGMCCYLFFMFRIIRMGVMGHDAISVQLLYSKRLIRALGWIIVFTTLVVTGPFNKSLLDAILILIGVMAAWIERCRKIAENDQNVLLPE